MYLPNIEFLVKKNKKINFDLTISLCLYDDRRCFLLVFNNISEKVTLERLETVNKLKDKLINSISHNLKTPLNGLAAFVNQLKQKITKDNFLK